MKEGLNSLNWKEFSLTKIFEDIQRGKRLKKDDHTMGSIPYASSTSLNNGIDGFIGNTSGVRVFENCLTIANSGSVGSTFYQPFKVIASDHVTKLENKKFNKYVYLFLATVVSRLHEKYGFNREINDFRIKKEKVLLPVTSKGNPDYAFMERYMKSKEEKLVEQFLQYISIRINNLTSNSVKSYSEVEWQEFFIEDVFTIKSGQRLIKSDMVSGSIPFIGATDANNGITAFINNVNSSLDKNVLGVNYNGSVVENFYHPYKAIFSDDVKRLSFIDFENNKYALLFCKSLILMQKSKYEWGYKFNGERMKRQKIMLPITDEGIPDFTFMENYMKILESQKLEAYLDYKKSNACA